MRIAMKKFMGEDFLLRTPAAELLYGVVKELPIFDFHNHLSAREIYENRSYGNLTEVWLSGDHYKWRVMRAMGIPEEQITGDAPDREKFNAWARTVPALIGNPLFHWTHLELKRYFGWEKVFGPETADEVWERTKELLQEPEFRIRSLLARQRVRVLCTTDDPADDLRWHELLRREKMEFLVCPTFRPDRALALEREDYPDYLERLSAAAGRPITSVRELLQALETRLDFFQSLGCRASDHSLEHRIYEEGGEERAEAVFAGRLGGKKPDPAGIGCFRGYVLAELGKRYAARGMVMQLHIGADRNQSVRLAGKLGADTGLDGMKDHAVEEELRALFNAMDREDALPKTVLYGLNPGQTEMLAVLAGSFCGGIPGKVQIGPAWWFNDQKKGIEAQLETFAGCSVLAEFIGMTTDSRSFLSFPRHEYFRRILCGRIGEWVENGEYPADEKLLAQMVRNICYYNAERFFRTSEPNIREI